MCRPLLLTIACAAALLSAPASSAARVGEEPASIPDRIEELQQELDSLTEDLEDLEEPVAEFELFDECMYLIGVTEYGRSSADRAYVYGERGTPRSALALDIRGFDRATYQFLAFPAEEPPSIECNEDAGEEDTDDD